MRVVFFGTPEFAVPSLVALLDAGTDVAAVVTQPDRPQGRSHSTLIAPPVKQRALAAGIPILQPERPRGDEFVAALHQLKFDLGVVVAYGHLLRPEVLATARLGFVNVHASLLPSWRGAAPIQWAILAGNRATGVSIMRVEAGLDSGAVWHERRTSITDDDTAGTLTVRLAQLGAVALMEALPAIVRGDEPVPQDEHGATLAPKINRNVARIRWNEPADAVARQIRAMDPAPGAWTTITGGEIKVVGATVAQGDVRARHASPQHSPQQSSPPPRAGTITQHGESVIVTTADNTAIIIDTVQPAGRRRMPAIEWLRGANLPADARFE